MEICNKCLWEYDEYDLYCSGCARDINSVDIKPVFDNNEIIIYPETKKIPLILSNTGLKGAITLTGIKANKDKVENTDNTLDLHSSRENSPAREKNLDILPNRYTTLLSQTDNTLFIEDGDWVTRNLLPMELHSVLSTLTIQDHNFNSILMEVAAKIFAQWNVQSTDSTNSGKNQPFIFPGVPEIDW